MNLLHVVHYPVFGGPHNQALRLAAPLQRRGWNTTVLLPGEPGNAAARFRAAGIEVVAIPLHRLRATRSIPTQARFLGGFIPEVAAIRRLIRSRSIDLVVIAGLTNPHAAIAARLEGIPVVWQLVDTRAPLALRRALTPLVTALADSVMTTGAEVARVHPGLESARDRLIVFAPPVDTTDFRPDPGRRTGARRTLGVPDHALVVGAVGNLNPQKGHEYFIRAAAGVSARYPDARFRILGGQTPTQAAYAARLRAEVRDARLSEPDTFAILDPEADVAALVPALDVLVLSSVPRSEGVPTVILEAMACGIPVVATDVGAVREVVEDGATGFVVPPLDPDATARATLRLLDDPVLRRRMGDLARQRAVERYDVEVCADVHVRAFEAALDHYRLRRAPDFGRPAAARAAAAASAGLRELLVCPGCHGALSWAEEVACCQSCGHSFPVIDGIPVLLLNGAAADHDELDHLHGVPHPHGSGESTHKQRQAAHFDRADAAEFEVNRPHGTPSWYRYLLAEKFRRSIRGIESALSGATALTVCGGSGMDAEFLSRAGAHVIASDISLGAARRAADRARRYGLPITVIIADVERLPFRDRSVDVVYVHDGLHHLERPEAGLSEMSRVAARAVSVTEPARARATQLAVRLRWALEHEEAGNRVARLTASEVTAVLRGAGLRLVHEERYAMYYRHLPDRVTRLLSARGAFPLARGGWRLANALVGRWGNKLTVQSVREPA
ncbi:MAG: glycosyltransferase [Dehalococcoidia bacterium]